MGFEWDKQSFRRSSYHGNGVFLGLLKIQVAFTNGRGWLHKAFLTERTKRAYRSSRSLSELVACDEYIIRDPSRRARKILGLGKDTLSSKRSEVRFDPFECSSWLVKELLWCWQSFALSRLAGRHAEHSLH